MNRTMSKIQKLCLAAMFMAMVCVATMVIRVPIPLGYAHLGNSIILIAVFYFDTKYGILAGSIGSALADLLLGYSIWILPTLIIKAALAVTASIIGRKPSKFKLYSIRTMVATVLSMIVMVVLYTLSGALLSHSWATGLTSAPLLAFEGLANIIAFFILGSVLNRIKIFNQN